MRGLIVLAAALTLFAGCQTAEMVDLTPKSSHVVDATEIEWKSETFNAGSRVISTGSAGTFKPKDTGLTGDLSVTAGKTGWLLGGVRRGPQGAKNTDEAIEVALVRWDTQMWDQLEVGAFEATIHVDYLDVVK